MKNAKKFLALILSLIMAVSCLTVAFAVEDPEEAEVNDTLAQANVINNNRIRGNIDQAGDVDFYKFANTTAGLLTLTFTHDSATSDETYFRVQVIDSDGETVMSSFFSKGTEDKVFAPKCSLQALAADAFYYIKVTQGTVCDVTNNYTIVLEVNTSAICESESNNDAASADPIDIGAPGVSAAEIPYYTGLLSSSADADWFSFDVSSPCYFYIYVGQDQSTNSRTDYKIELFTYDDDSNGQYSLVKSLGSFIAPANAPWSTSPSVGVGTDTYYIKITCSDEFNYGAYQLGVLTRALNVKEGFTVESEPNNDKASADKLVLNGGIYGSNFDESDADWYYVNLATAYDSSFTFGRLSSTKPATTTRWDIYIYNADGTSVDDIHPTSDSEVTYNFPKGVAGKYYIKVSSSTNLSSPCDYQLKLSYVEHEKELTFWEKVQQIDFSTIWSALSFITNFNWKEILPSFGGQLLNIFAFIIGMIG